MNWLKIKTFLWGLFRAKPCQDLVPISDAWLSRVLVKKGVSLANLRPEIKKCLKQDLELHEELNKALIVTSTFDGKHMEGSKHYEHQAYDTRIWFLTKKTQLEMAAKLQDLMGSSYDILVEKTHGHREYDPK